MSITANQLINKTIEAHGGMSWQHPKTLQLYGHAVMYRPDENDLILDTYTMHRVFPKNNANARKANGKVALLAKTKSDVFFDLRFDGNQSYRYLSEQAKKFRAHFLWSNNFGFGIIRHAIDQKLQYRLISEYRLGDIPCYYINITDASGQETIFGIHKTQFRIIYMGFNTPLGFHLRVYDHFTSDMQHSFLMPLTLKIYYDNQLWFQVFWDKFLVNIPIASKIFTIN